MQKHVKGHLLSFVLLQATAVEFVMISIPVCKGTFERVFGAVLFNV